jgi:hypothetical protein
MLSRNYLPTFSRKSSAPSLRSGKGKRKRNAHDDGSNEGMDEDVGFIEPSSSQYMAEAALQPEVAKQYRTAGLPFDQELPRKPFPHRSLDFRAYVRNLIPSSQLFEEVPHFYSPLVRQFEQEKQSVAKSSLKQRHVTVLFALMHRCLLQGDYLRAGRAFGLLMRTESEGRLIDIRTQSLWGIGAEVLLHSKDQVIKGDGSGNLGMDSDGETISLRSNPFNLEGVELAKRYYERLIVQYPYNSHSVSISALQFYPILLGLWIASIDSKYRADITLLESIDESRDSYDTRSGRSESLPGRYEELENSRRIALQGAREVEKRLDAIMQDLPYSDDEGLWRLRGHVYIWIGDLVTLSKPSDSSHNWDDHSVSETADIADSAELREARGMAEIAFKKAETCKKMDSPN